jgi:hypothetical protein
MEGQFLTAPEMETGEGKIGVADGILSNMGEKKDLCPQQIAVMYVIRHMTDAMTNSEIRTRVRVTIMIKSSVIVY